MWEHSWLTTARGKIITTIIGIDCAAQAKKMGLAIGNVQEAGLPIVHEVVRNLGWDDLVEHVSAKIETSQRCLLALDAPFGWPAPLREQLSEHKAGEPLEGRPDDLFMRLTDQVVWRAFGKRPLEVGADRIARVARAALQLLDELRARTGRRIPLSWDPRGEEPASAIEVYPAATMWAHSMEVPSYKGQRPEHQQAREQIVRDLSKRIRLEGNRTALIESHDLLDATVCVLAGADFAQDLCRFPTDIGRAHGEGWIWFKESY